MLGEGGRDHRLRRFEIYVQQWLLGQEVPSAYLCPAQELPV